MDDFDRDKVDEIVLALMQLTLHDYYNTDEITLNSSCIHFSLADAYTDLEFEEPEEEM